MKLPDAAWSDRRSWLLPAISGVCLPLAYAPFSVPLMAAAGLVPFFVWLGRPRTAREIKVGGWAFAVPFFVAGLLGLAVMARFTSAALAGFIGTFFLHVATFFFVPIVLNVMQHARPLPLAIVAPPVWIVSEQLRTFGDLDFPWLSLGYALAGWPRLAQHADLVGVYGISFWLVAINALLAQLWLARRAGAPWRGTLAALAAVTLPPLVYGAVVWPTLEAEIRSAPSLRVAIVQPNVAQGTKWTPEAAAGIFARVNAFVADAERSSPDLVVGPEATLPFALAEDAARLPETITPGSRPLLLGVITGIGEGSERRAGSTTFRTYGRHYNSAVLVSADREVWGRHDKQLLVPVTEQIPFRHVFGFVLPMMRNQFGRFVPGEELTTLELPTARGPVRFGALICYESLFPKFVRRLHGMGARFFVNISNDAWFGRTNFTYQHAGFAALRAIENRASVVRCSNPGVSALFDPLGRTVGATPLFVDAVRTFDVPLVEHPTVYQRVGDVAVGLAYAATAALLTVAWRAWRTRGRG